MRVTILGCGGSTGVPVIGNKWGRCDPGEPRNRRTRASILVDGGGSEGTLLIDSSPDMRQQLLAAGVERVDAVLYTHHHADHVHGIDDLREICRLRGRALDAWGMASHLDEIRQRFGYAFAPLPEGQPIYRPVLNARIIAADATFTAAGMTVRAFAQDHGYCTTLGFRIGNFAYSTDVVRLDEAAFATLDGVRVWVVDCVRDGPPHPVHAHLDLTLEWIARVRPRRAILTHMGNQLDYRTLLDRLPPGVEPGYDGLTVDISDE
jgi:phosphoribosyl 1,2-cyclic phosphate phosphodiesterase